MRKILIALTAFVVLHFVSVTSVAQTLEPPLPQGTTYYKGMVVSQIGVGVIGCTHAQVPAGDGNGCITPSGGITGSGTAGYYPIFTGPTAVSNGTIDYGITTPNTLSIVSPQAVVILSSIDAILMDDSIMGFYDYSTSGMIFQESGGGAIAFVSTHSIQETSVLGHFFNGFDSAIPGAISFQNGTTPPLDTPNYIQIAAPSAVTAYTMLLPGAQGTGALTNDGSGNLSWVPGATGTVTDGAGTTTPNMLAESTGTAHVVQYVAAPIDEYFTVTGCNVGGSTDNQCSGTFNLPTAMPDASYELFVQTNNLTGGENLLVTISMTALPSTPTTTIDYVLTCTFGCSSTVSPAMYVHAHHD